MATTCSVSVAFFIFIWNLMAKLQGNGVIIIHLEDLSGYHEKIGLLLTIKKLQSQQPPALNQPNKTKKPSTHDVWTGHFNIYMLLIN